jgi:hypothetical protein
LTSGPSRRTSVVRQTQVRQFEVSIGESEIRPGLRSGTCVGVSGRSAQSHRRGGACQRRRWLRRSVRAASQLRALKGIGIELP